MKKDAGFSMVELLVVLGIIAALAVVTIPGFLAYIPNYRLNAASQEFLGDIQMAKLRAVKKGVVVSIRINTVTDTYTMFVDDGIGANYGNGAFNAGEETLKTVTMPTGINIVSTTFTADAVQFNSRGLPFNWNVGQIDIQNRKNRTKTIEVFMAGSAEVN
jgi:prepilin-type N-terminal cleavage/methylation domain-containing protein